MCVCVVVVVVEFYLVIKTEIMSLAGKLTELGMIVLNVS